MKKGLLLALLLIVSGFVGVEPAKAGPDTASKREQAINILREAQNLTTGDKVAALEEVIEVVQAGNTNNSVVALNKLMSKEDDAELLDMVSDAYFLIRPQVKAQQESMMPKASGVYTNVWGYIWLYDYVKAKYVKTTGTLYWFDVTRSYLYSKTAVPLTGYYTRIFYRQYDVKVTTTSGAVMWKDNMFPPLSDSLSGGYARKDFYVR
ncbi:MAG: hypothetical protein IT291_02010 [Deltaproteobacteria bacterium]|nr:hypothetical protein [Deltaproteobacteria bacterium]